MLFLLLSSTTSMIFPYLMGNLFGGTTSDSQSFELFNLDNVDSIVILLFIVFGAQAIFSYFRIVLFGYVTEKTLKDLRHASFNQLVKSPLSFYNSTKTAELVSRIATDINLLQDTLNTTIAEFCRQIITIAVSLTLIFMLSPKLALIMLAVVPGVALFAVFFGRFIKKLSKATQDEVAASNSILSDTLSGIANVKAYTKEWFESKRYGDSLNSIKGISLKRIRWRGLFTSFIIFFMFGAIALVIWQGKLLTESGHLEQKHFFSFILYTIFLGASIGSFPELYAKIQRAVGATDDLMNLFNHETEAIELTESNVRKRLNGDISISNLEFHYDSRPDVKVLKNISLNINSGEKIALVGPSGSGKSTLASLLFRFYDRKSGTLNIDGKDINSYELSEYRNNLAIVPQDVILFGGTIKENIAYGNLNATQEEIENAAKKANSHNFISSFPDGYETLVGDRGIQLSGGQRQRIAIARAILKDPSILILDEATSSLDSESERLVQEALENVMENRTSIVIAHRLSTIKNCDKILVLENGELIESGSHDDLIAKDEGVYRNLSELQV